MGVRNISYCAPFSSATRRQFRGGITLLQYISLGIPTRGSTVVSEKFPEEVQPLNPLPMIVPLPTGPIKCM